MSVLFRKWWVLLIQGILLIILSGYIIKNPVITIAGISIWVGLVLLATGLLGIIVWLFANRSEREGMSLLWNILVAVLGLLLLMNILATMQILIFFFGFWMLATAVLLVLSGWASKDKTSTNWFLIVIGILFAVFSIMMIFNIGIGVVALSTLLSFQVLLIGISLIILSFMIKSVREKLRSEIQSRSSEFK